MSIDKRTHPRVSLSQTASVTNQGTTRQATLANLSIGGAFLSGLELPTGSGIRIAFRLSTGLPVTVNGKVVRTASGTVGVQFFQLDDVTREILDDYLKSAGAGSTDIDAEVSVKYQTSRANGRLTLKLQGYLETADCLRVRELVSGEVTSFAKRDLMFVIDASLFSCCSPDGLKEFRALFEGVKKGCAVMGGLIGQRTVGVLQLRRVIRDSGVADAFMGFETTAEADELLAALSAG